MRQSSSMAAWFGQYRSPMRIIVLKLLPLSVLLALPPSPITTAVKIALLPPALWVSTGLPFFAREALTAVGTLNKVYIASKIYLKITMTEEVLQYNSLDDTALCVALDAG